MEETGRTYLTGSLILSRHEDGSSPEKYTVEKVLGEGGSTVCYQATRVLSDGTIESGKLKEYYPIDAVLGRQNWYYSLRRLPDGQLVPGAGTVRKFEEMCADFLHTYRLLKKVVADNNDNEILKSYIQHGEILYGVLDTSDRKADGEDWDVRRPTVYIWSSGLAGEGFDQWLSLVRSHPAKNPEENLKTILTVVSALADCIKALHTAGLMHLDIKPSNFLVQYDSDHRIRPESISLFDISSLRSVDGKYAYLSGTEGFTAPEVMQGKADNRSDIYSIGAMLFYALVYTKDIPDGLYRDFYYPMLGQLLKGSRLFQGSEINSDSALLSRLLKILEKCLARNPARRYGSCSELKADLDAAVKRMSRLMQAPLPGLPEGGIADPTLAIDRLLYEHPLFEAVPEGQKNIHVLVLGAGNYGQRFIDICMQAGQMIGTRLSITAVSDQPQENMTDYLKFRPAVSEFVHVTGPDAAGTSAAGYAAESSPEETSAVSAESESSCASGKETYADLDFRLLEDPNHRGEPAHLGGNSAANRVLIRKLFLEAEKNGAGYDYIFVSLGRDAVSRSAARICAEEAEELAGRCCPVGYVSRRIVNPRKADLRQKLYPVNINEPVQLETIDADLGEMAFNTHMSWESGMGIDVKAVREKFFEAAGAGDRYNLRSSVAFVLSIPYKMHSVHIETGDLKEAARLFSSSLLEKRKSDAQIQKTYDAMVNLEHRRWLLQMACEGWTAPRKSDGTLDLEGCISRGSVKDKAKMQHPCMVRGSASSPLSMPAYTAQNHKKWDTGEIDPDLDPLDTMSVSLHRVFRKEADRLRKENLYQMPDLTAIEDLIPESEQKMLNAFRQYRFVLKNILAGIPSYAKQHRQYQENFMKALDSLPEETKAKIRERLEVLNHIFFPVEESCLYRNYKAYDNILVDKIPYIVTYRSPKTLSLAFSDGKFENGRSEAVFPDVASATVLNPEKILYLYCIDRDTDAQLFLHKLDAVLNYLNGRSAHCAAGIAAVCLQEVSEKTEDAVRQGFEQLKEKYQEGKCSAYFQNPVLMEAADSAEASLALEKIIAGAGVSLYDAGGRLFPSVLDDAAFHMKLTGSVPVFEFDWRRKKFIRHIGCDFLQYVRDDSFIRIRDMFDLMNAEDTHYNLPEFTDDLEPLWQIYTGTCPSRRFTFDNAVGNWNRLCGCLQDYEDSRPPLASFELSADPEDSYETKTFYLPHYTWTTVRSLLQKLKDAGIAAPESKVWTRTSDTLVLEVAARKQHVRGIESVFSRPQLLLPYYEFQTDRITAYNTVYIEIRYSSLHVDRVNLNPQGRWDPRYSMIILGQLQDAHMISNLIKDENDPAIASFDYVSPRIKKVLTQAGEILEIYAYYDVLKTGCFDDAATGYEFRWEEGGVKNELDLVLTKGFRSMIVECKAVKQLELTFYHKLHSIASQFGIGTVSVLVGNTYQAGNAALKQINTMERSRGEQLSILTISGEDSIRNIGRTLARIMEEQLP